MQLNMKAFSSICSHLSKRLHSLHRIGISTSEKRTYCINIYDDSNRDGLFSTRTVSATFKEAGSENVMENFPCSPTKLRIYSKKLNDEPQLSVSDLDAELAPLCDYFIEIGLGLDQLNRIRKRSPCFVNYSLEHKIKPFVQLLLDLGVPKTHISTILYRRPSLCGLNLAENFKATMSFLENLGVGKEKWAKVIYYHPALLTYSMQKLKENVDFLYEMGIPPNNVGKILTRWSSIIGYSVEYKLRPTADYFRSLGVDVARLLNRYPQNFGLSIDTNLIPVTNFFLEKGFTIEEVGSMISRFGGLYTFGLAKNIIPKWEFFLTMDYSRDDLIKFPQYFGYSLEARIKPRYARVKECGVMFPLNPMLARPKHEFEMSLENKMKKMLSLNNRCITHCINEVEQ